MVAATQHSILLATRRRLEVYRLYRSTIYIEQQVLEYCYYSILPLCSSTREVKKVVVLLLASRE